MKNLSVEIDEVQSSEFEEVIERLDWSKALVMRALLAYFLKLAPDEQEKFVKKYRVKKESKKKKGRD